MKQRKQAALRASTEPEIVRTLETLGCVVWRIAGAGLPRLIVIRRNGRWLADVKGPKQWPTRSQEKAWEQVHALGCEVFVLRTPEDARDMVSGALAPWAPRSATAKRIQADNTKPKRVVIPTVRVLSPRAIPSHEQTEDGGADSKKAGCPDCRALGRWCQYC